MSHYLTDHATHKDLLNYDDFQDALYDVVTNAETPLTVGVFGPWGSGKTSLMQMLRNQIEAEKLDSRRTVWFTAWKYDRQEALWRSFILRVIDALYPREDEPDNLPREERPLIKDPGEREKRLIELLGRLEESVYQAVDWEEIGDRAVNWWQFISNMTKAGVETSAAVGTAGLSMQFKKLLGGDDTPVEEVQKAAEAISKQTKSYHRRQLFHMEQFENTFKEAVKLISKEGNGRLIVFVDDLDRCLPEKAVEVLEAIKLFLEVPGVVFVLGMDQCVIRRGIEARYGSFFKGADEDGERRELPIRGDSYLQKIVQIPFHLPALAVDDVRDFIQDLDQPLSDRTQAVLARGVYPNPRQIKRVLNILRLLRRIADRRFQENDIEITDPLLAKTVIIQTQYPALYQLWRQYPTLVQTLETEYARRPSSDEERLTGLRPLPPETGATESPKDDETTVAKAAEAGQGGLLSKYFKDRSRYALLEQLMTYPPESEAGSGADRDRFSGLSRVQVAAYVRLAGAVESDAPAPLEISTSMLEALLSGDPLQIQDAASVLQGLEPERITSAQQQMVQVLSDANQPTSTRLSAGNALAHLGDPRFHDEAGFYLPDDEMLGFVEIPAGNFRMGSDPEEATQAEKNEQPQHSLNLDTFYMAKYPVTVAQFQLFVNRSGHKPANEDSLQGLPNHPVRNVNWYDALAYIDWLQQTLNQWPQTPAALRQLLQQWRLVLPSEAEWEKAARGSDGRLYPWGNEFKADNANHKATGLDSTCTVGCYPGGTSSYGLFDMSGNVWEWTRTIGDDKKFPYPYKVDDGRETIDKQNKSGMILRGGAFYSEPASRRCASRFRRNDPQDGDWNLGMRLCLSPFAP